MDSEEYQTNFGEDTVPFARILGKNGRAQVGFNRPQPGRGLCSQRHRARQLLLVNSVATGMVPSGWSATPVGSTAPAPSPAPLILKRFRIVVAAQTAAPVNARPTHLSGLPEGHECPDEVHPFSGRKDPFRH